MLLHSLGYGFLCAAMLPLTASLAVAAPAPARACQSSQLRAVVSSDSGAMLHRDIAITLTNRSTSACIMDGYPAVRLLDAQHRASVAAESFSGAAPHTFSLAPGQHATFEMLVATTNGVVPAYPTMPILAIIPPGDIVPLLLRHGVPASPTIDMHAIAPGS
jgi:hypothetical protein